MPKCTCSVCGREYGALSVDSKFCSQLCEHSINRVVKNCLACGAEFTTKKCDVEDTKYCKNCLSRFGPVERVCARCGKKHPY